MEVCALELVTELEALKRRMEAAPSDGKPWEIVFYLVSDTVAALKRGVESVDFERQHIIHGCLPGHKVDEVDPKKWVPHIDQLRRVLAGQSDAVELLYANRGGRGNPSVYRLQLKASTGEELAPGDEPLMLRAQPIRYTRSSSGEIKPSVLARPFLKNELRNRSWRGLVFLVGFVLCGALLCASVPLLFLLFLVYGSATIELKQLLTLVFLSAVFWLVWRQVNEPFLRLIDDRIVKAPAWVVGIAEDPCELEMHRQDDGQWTRLVRFKAECSLCGGDVELRGGRPDHPYPLVGRCVNSPHAHVYSFDRMLLKGSYIGPPLD